MSLMLMSTGTQMIDMESVPLRPAEYASTLEIYLGLPAVPTREGNVPRKARAPPRQGGEMNCHGILTAWTQKLCGTGDSACILGDSGIAYQYYCNPDRSGSQGKASVLE